MIVIICIKRNASKGLYSILVSTTRQNLSQQCCAFLFLKIYIIVILPLGMEIK